MKFRGSGFLERTNMRWFRAVTEAGIVLCALTPLAAAEGVNTGYFGGVAIEGYDTVAYFTEAKARPGSAEYRHEFLGETWHFATAAHRDLFAANPIAYAPQYGGFCAAEMLYADVTTGITTNIDPEAWRIIDGKLYLFYDQGYAELFEEDASTFVRKADGNWMNVQERLTD